MGEKIILETNSTDDRARIDLDYTAVQLIETRDVTSFEPDKNKLSKHVSHYVTGVNPRSHHRYWKWMTISSDTVGMTKNGQFYNTRMWGGHNKRTKTFTGDDPHLWHTLAHPTNYNSFGIHALTHLGMTFNINDIYPMSEHWHIEDYYHMPRGIPEFKEEDPKAFIERLFGKTRYRKDLAKAVFECKEPALFNMAVAFKQYVPIDWIVHFLRTNKDFERPAYVEGAENALNTRRIKLLLPHINPRSYRHLMFSEFTEQNYREMFDVINRGLRFGLPPMVGVETVRDFSGLHRLIWPEGRNQIHIGLGGNYIPPKVDLTQEIPVVPKAAELAKSNMVRLPKVVGDLYTWSDEMSNCISSYARDVAKKDATTILGKIVHEDKTIACFELQNNYRNASHLESWQLTQLLGKYNQAIPYDIQKMVEFLMKENGIKVDSYWGKSA